MKPIVEAKLAPVRGRYSEKWLHIPADMAVISVSVGSLLSAGTLVLLVAAALFVVGLVIFSA